MGYLALYREWRPQRFDEVVGQDHVKRTLQNALSNGRIAHAYLFTGPRGTGKTTVAKLLAKAVNCKDQSSVEPCNRCSACVSITEGSSMDVLEIDAASNRRIEEIREIRDRVRYAPAENRYKVYIVDEVHMLTPEASNALLKTLEEPPEHVIFVLATTDPHKLLRTIISRCQRFDFHLLPADLIAGRLQQVCRKRGVTCSDEAIMLIARHAEGAMRDGLSLLDQVLSFGGDELTLEDVLSVLGTAQDDVFFDLVEAVCVGDVGAVLEMIDQIALKGVDIRQFIKDLTGHIRNLLVVDIAEHPATLVPVGSEAIERLRDQSSMIGRDTIMLLVDSLAEIDGRLRWSPQPRLVAEVELLRLARELGSAGERKNVESATRDSTDAGPEPDPQRKKPEANLSVHVGEDVQQPPVARSENIDLGEYWTRVRDRVKAKSRRAEAWLIPAEPLDLSSGTLTIRFPANYELHYHNIRDKHREVVRAAVSAVFGRTLDLNLVLGDGDVPGETATQAASGSDSAEKQSETGEAVDDPEPLPPFVKQAMDIFDGELVEVRDEPEQAEQEEG